MKDYQKISNNKSQMTNNSQPSKPNQNKIYDLEDRTFEFSKSVVLFTKKLPKTASNIEYIKQVIRSSGSIGANYIEANECLGQKDFKMRIKICRKEAKETAYWLKLIAETNDSQVFENAQILFQESIELKKIFSSMIK